MSNEHARKITATPDLASSGMQHRGHALVDAKTHKKLALGEVNGAEVSDKSKTQLDGMTVAQLHEEVARLNHELALLKNKHKAQHIRLNRFDDETGLPSRSHLLERGAAEFRRAERYDHHVSVLLVSVRGLDTIEAQNGKNTADAIFCSVAQLCESLSRSGIDILGVYERRMIAIILPETRLSGALALVDRIKEIAAREPFQVGLHQVRPALNVTADAKLQDDEGIQACLSRAYNAMTANLT